MTDLPLTTLTSVFAADGTQVPILVHQPHQPRGWLVWAHGGSWQRGSITEWASVTRSLAAESGWAVVSVDYRLAPTHRFPAAVIDALTALDWAEEKARGQPVVVGGDSAGGTIAASAAVARRDAGGKVPPQLLAYPPLDPECANPSYRADPDAFPTRNALKAAWRQWFGPHRGGGPAADAGTMPAIYPTPLLAPRLDNLAPVSLVVGDHDPVRDDLAAYAELLRSNGVTTTLDVVPGAGHADLLQRTSRTLPVLVTALDTMLQRGAGASVHEPTISSKERTYP